MAAIDPWDEHLEAATGLLDGLTGGGRGGRLFIQAPGDWHLEMRGTKRTVWVQVAGGAGQHLVDDYRLVLVYSLGYHAPPGEAHPTTFTKQLSLQEGYNWDEQTLREIVLEALGLLRHVFSVPASARLQLDDQTRPAAGLSLARGKLPRRRRS
ncbi:MAG: hypothetical protein ACKVT1_08775 [Dehalococcoidia bacterium]